MVINYDLELLIIYDLELGIKSIKSVENIIFYGTDKTDLPCLMSDFVPNLTRGG